MRKLRDAFSALQYAARQRIEPLSPKPTKLDQILTTLDFQRVVRPPRIRPDLAPKWQAAIHTDDYAQISNRDIRHLFWDKNISLSQEFIKLLVERQVVVRRSGVKGLVYSLASRWDEIISGTLRVENYHEIISKLCQSDFLNRVKPYIFSKSGHKAFAEQVAQRRTSLSDHFSNVFGILLPSTHYTNEVMGSLAETAFMVALSPAHKDREWFYHSVLNHLSKDRLIPCLGRIVKAIESSNAEEAKEELKAFVLAHPNLGDPRLPGFEGNWDKRDAITLAVIEWLSQSDINFFFELFFQEHADVQGRKKFWLPYAHAIRGTRVVMSYNDKRRLFRRLAEIDGKKISSSIFGDGGLDVKATAFIMDFGSVKVVEFSLPNHACYFYDAKSKFQFNDRSRFWETKNFRESELKDAAVAHARLAHRPPDWERKFSNHLAGFGIRPKLNRKQSR